ncbi:MAG: hypothetical protein H7A36_05450 [Chlamydiales bacterium]|nr:hypothetical protein [Chlamydiales bacterium]
MAGPTCPTINFNLNCAETCNQMSCCSRGVHNQLDNHTVVYNQADGEITNEPPEGFSLLGCISTVFLCCFRGCSKAQVQERRREALEGISLYLNENFEVTIDQAAGECGLKIEVLRGGRKRIRVGDFHKLEEGAKAFAEKRSGSSPPQVRALERKTTKRFQPPPEPVRRGRQERQITLREDEMTQKDDTLRKDETRQKYDTFRKYETYI